MADIIGTDGKDELYGTFYSDRIEGLGGDDRIDAGGSSDVVLAGDGHDRISSHSGSDQLYGEAGNDYIWIGQTTHYGELVIADGGTGNDVIGFRLFGAGGTIEIYGGDGNDCVWISIMQSSTGLLTLGQGQDSIRFDADFQELGEGSISVADFEVGDSGDWFDWDTWLHRILADWDRQANPFTAGYLKLVQDGADTLLQVDRDGSAGAGAASTLITLRNVDASALTAANLGGYDPAGGAVVGRVVTGTSELDMLRGSVGDDLVEGLGGKDELAGGLGNDLLRGGDGDDSVRGDGGSDRLEGGLGADDLNGGAGDDRLFGGEGDDVLVDGEGGLDELYGEDGNDTIRLGGSSSTEGSTAIASGGNGDDFIHYNYSYGDGTVDAGSGADVVELVSAYEGNVTVTLGEGRDTVRLGRSFSTYLGSAVINDFEVGPEGDRLEWIDFLGGEYVRGWDGATNPFAAGFASLVQSGADTLLVIDEDGPDRHVEGLGWVGHYDPKTLLVFKNVQAASLTAAHLGGFSPDGSAPLPEHLTGTEGADVLAAGPGSDLVEGGDGDDKLSGSAGHDILRGGPGNDTLTGDLGNDILEGGDGADFLYGRAGNDRLYGGEGNDDLTTSGGKDEELHGEGGNDAIELTHWGSDFSWSMPDRVLATGGDGNDTFWVTFYTNADVTLDAGSGADVVWLREISHGGITVTLGEGRDALAFASFYRLMPGQVEVTDFTGGADGDYLKWSEYLKYMLVGWDKVVNPFAAGYLTLVQDGADVLVTIDRDLTGIYAEEETLVTLRNVDLDNLGAANFDGWDPHSPFVINGTAGADSLTGRRGRDLIDGGAGADSMAGGIGNDIYYVDNVDDSVIENTGEGTDEIRTSLQSYTLQTHVENLTFIGAGASALRANGVNNVVKGGESGDILYLQQGGDDRAEGLGGSDGFYFGGTFTESDQVDGGAGQDELILQGDYSGGATLAGMSNVELVVLMPGNDQRFGAPGTQSYDYRITTTDSTVAPGALLNVDGNRLRAGEDLVFDGSAERDGSFYVFAGKGVDTLTGGAGNDAFLFRGPGNFTAADMVTGGAGLDELALRGDYTGQYAVTFAASTITGIEAIVVVSGSDTRYGKVTTPCSFDLKLDDANVVPGQRLIVDAGTLRFNETLKVDGSAESDGSFKIFGGKGNDVLIGGSGADWFRGGTGADVLTGGGGADSFVYRNASESSGTHFDTIVGFDSGVDRIDLPVPVAGFSAIASVSSGKLDDSSFDSDLAAAVDGALDPARALLFTASSGDHSGKTFLIVDGNGDGSYQVDQDYVVWLKDPAQPIPTTDTGFIV